MPRWLQGILLGAVVTGVLYAAGLGGPAVYIARGIALHVFYSHGAR